MFPLKLVRKTANGDLELDGFPIHIAGTVDSESALPVLDNVKGAIFEVVINDLLCSLHFWSGKQWDCIFSTEENTSKDTSGDCSITPIDTTTLNQILQQTGFPVINKQ